MTLLLGVFTSTASLPCLQTRLHTNHLFRLHTYYIQCFKKWADVWGSLKPDCCLSDLFKPSWLPQYYVLPQVSFDISQISKTCLEHENPDTYCTGWKAEVTFRTSVNSTESTCIHSWHNILMPKACVFFSYRTQCPPHYHLCSSHPGYLSGPHTAPGPNTASSLIEGLGEKVWWQNIK